MLPILRPDPPLIFFMPPAAGVETVQARFLATFGEAAKFVVIQYPPLAQMLKGRAQFERIVDAVVTQVTEKCPQGPYLLLGYSFGGFVARESARRLSEGGEEVKFLGLIDSRLEIQGSSEYTHVKVLKLLAKLSTRPREAALRGRLWIFEHLPLAVTKFLNCLRLMLPRKLASEFELELATRLRMKLLHEAKIKPLKVKTTLFQSREQFSGKKLPYNWDTISDNLVEISVGGSHTSLFDPPHCMDLRERILEALNSSQAIHLQELATS